MENIQGVFLVTYKPPNNQKSCTGNLLKKKKLLPEESKFKKKQISNHRDNPRTNSADRVISPLSQFPHLDWDILHVPSIACIRACISSMFVLGH